MAVNKKNIMTRYFFVVLVMGLLGIAIVVKAAITALGEHLPSRAHFRVKEQLSDLRH